MQFDKCLFSTLFSNYVLFRILMQYIDLVAQTAMVFSEVYLLAIPCSKYIVQKNFAHGFIITYLFKCTLNRIHSGIHWWDSIFTNVELEPSILRIYFVALYVHML